MRKTLSRVIAATTGAVLATMLLPSGTASAATSDDCDRDRSTRIVTGGLFGNTTDHVWVDQQTATRTVVCFQFQSLSLGGLTVIVDAASGATLPSVTPGANPALCPNQVLQLADPVELRIAVGLASNSVCLTLDGNTLSVQFSPGNIGPTTFPVFELWRDGGPAWGWVDVAACPAEWALAVAFGGPDTCMRTNDRVFP